MIAHMVFFTLEDASPEAQQQLVDGSYEYLKGLPGVAYFSAGRRIEEMVRPVNDKEFHVAIHVVFADRAAHDYYQTAEQHLAFIEKFKANWKQVRLFDSLVEA